LELENENKNKRCKNSKITKCFMAPGPIRNTMPMKYPIKSEIGTLVITK
jgi:hypothetical protein